MEDKTLHQPGEDQASVPGLDIQEPEKPQEKNVRSLLALIFGIVAATGPVVSLVVRWLIPIPVLGGAVTLVYLLPAMLVGVVAVILALVSRRKTKPRFSVRAKVGLFLGVASLVVGVILVGITVVGVCVLAVLAVLAAFGIVDFISFFG